MGSSLRTKATISQPFTVALSLLTLDGMERLAPGSMAGAGHGRCALEIDVGDVDAEHARLVRMAMPVVHWELSPLPLLYLSAYFEAHRQDYYALLLAVSERGGWAEWVSFFL